ncbi:AmmeMemoRadiSam system protein A, partial [candidate division GN15 bacterium]|nr:AmmeMemoRadiSam system protein A [candidate division GN15 bacterium]
EESILALGEALAAALKGTNTLMVASTVLSHFYHQKQANKLDTAIREAVMSFDPQQVIDTLQSGKGEACGGGPVASVMLASKRLGAEGVTFLDYTTSGEVTGDFTEVVGYLSAAIVSGKEARPATSEDTRAAMGARPAKREVFEVTEEQRELLLQIARDSIKAALDDKKYEPPYRESLDVRRGVFVTLKIDGQLRGCIGMIKAREPLFDAVATMARAAAFDDPRFPQLSPDEYERLEYEISVLSPLERVKDFDRIKIGRDGLMIKLDMHNGLLLPQVATEQGWDAITFLEQTCLKAGLPKESYKDRFAEVYKFSAVVFGED